MSKIKKISLRLSTPRDVKKTLSRISNLVANGEMDTKQANTIILACNTILGAIRLDEQQKKIEMLEELINGFAE
ncbi:MAG: hypothetical protein E6167_08415 [Varibaculum cambriense]|nr:hypothetical protein [Varibaculum cambriense]